MLPSPAPYTVVVVGDTPDLRSLWKLMLEHDERFDVVADAANGRTGVAAAWRHQPDLVLLDIAMPVMDGLQALALIREQSPRSAVVMLSAFSLESAQAALAMRLGAHGYLRKGLPRDVRLGKLHGIIRRTTPAGGAAWLC